MYRATTHNASAPAKPVATSYDPSTDSLSGLTSGWSLSFPSFDPATQDVYESFAAYDPSASSLSEFSVPFEVGAEIGPAGSAGPTGAKGDDGEKGDKGDTGAGVVAGGETGQALVKKSATDYDTEWATISGGGSGSPVYTFNALGLPQNDGIMPLTINLGQYVAPDLTGNVVITQSGASSFLYWS